MPLMLNGRAIDLGHRYPDGTFSLRLDAGAMADATHHGAIIDWHYGGEHELVALIYLAWHLRGKGIAPINLRMPYIPNARLDRVKGSAEVFTLKYFAGVINSLGFDVVSVLDPHSSVSVALIDHILVKQPTDLIKSAVASITGSEGEAPLMFYPDEGAMKRYSELIKAPYAFGIKKRDWETGKITDLEIHGQDPTGRPILMVDDICSRGGTFHYSAMGLKAAGAGNIYIFVTHCERAIFDGELLKDDLITHVFTTNSIFHTLSDEQSAAIDGKITIWKV